MTTVEILNTSVTDATLDALIVGVNADGTLVANTAVNAEDLAVWQSHFDALQGSSKLEAVTVIPGGSVARVIVVGTGDSSAAALRDAVGAASRARGDKAVRVGVSVPAADDAALVAAIEGALLGSYSFTAYKSKPSTNAVVWLVDGASTEIIEQAKIVANAVNTTRDLVNTPPLDLFPGSFADLATEKGAEFGLKVTVWDEKQLADEGFGGIVGVGQGSTRPPRLVRVAWAPEGAKETIALVGKGITFDTGGISLKPSKSMETMKSDMAGAAAVLTVLQAVAELKLPIAVTGWLCLAENMPSGAAQRPSDVVKTYNGTTVEVLNTDAEGRMVLADGLARAVEEKPDYVIDIATLTGAQGVALGTRTSAVMGTPALRDAVVSAANDVAEPVWPMPLPDHLREAIKSQVADLQNMGDPQGGGMLTGGVFLEEFVGDVPWAHIDIARPSFNEGKPFGYTPKGATGSAVRTLLQFLSVRV